jgi:aryl-alcohol dehydrogenase-like predicted oxidoreductase
VTNLPTRPLGGTGHRATRLGLGLAALGRPGYLNLGHGDDLDGRRDIAGLADHAADVLDAAWDAGIRYVDTARSYGRAEEFLGRWLDSRGRRPGDLVVASKWGYTYTAGWRTDAETHEVKDHSPVVLERQWAETRRALGEHLVLYQIHSVTVGAAVLDDPVVLRRLALLRRNGTAVGLTTSGPGQAEAIRSALAVHVDGQPLFDAVQATWNLLEPSAGAALAEAHAAGLGVVVKEAVANGRLTARHPDGPAVAAHPDVPPDAAALAAALAQPWADVVLSGAATVDQLRSNLAALDVDPESVPSPRPEDPERYWARRRELPWT